MMLKLKGIIEIFKRKDNNATKVFSLAPIVPDNKKGYDIYEQYLRQAFKDPSIKNIAITGNYGIGKSSFLTWFSDKKKYLFVSLCNFKANEKCNINSLEFNLVQQLIIGCKGVSQNKKRVKFSHFIFAFVFNIILAFILLSTNYMGCLDFIDNHCVNVNFTVIIEKVQKYVYFLIAIVYFVGFPFLFSNITSRISLKKLSFKFSKIETELEIENKQNFSFIDFYRAELVNTLRNYSKKFDYTVVFEDMDRLDFDNSITIFSELREINRLINMFPAKFNVARKTVRFIYVIQDGIFNSVDCSSRDIIFERSQDCSNIHLKFFDYIMPFVPFLLEEASSSYILTCLYKINFNCSIEFINIVGKYIFDYRVIENIINEYCVIRDIYLVVEDHDLSILDEKHLMALSVYKTLMPEDYNKIRINKSIIQRFQHSENKCIDQLILHGWLCLDCLKYVGFSESEIKKYIRNLFFSTQFKTENFEYVQNLLISKYILCKETILDNSEKINFSLLEELVRKKGYTILALEVFEGRTDLICMINEKINNLHIEEVLTEEQLNICKNFLKESPLCERENDKIIQFFSYLYNFSPNISDFMSEIDDRVYEYVFKCFINFIPEGLENYLRTFEFAQWINKASEDLNLFNRITDAIQNNIRCKDSLLKLPDLDEYVRNSFQILV